MFLVANLKWKKAREKRKTRCLTHLDLGINATLRISGRPGIRSGYRFHPPLDRVEEVVSDYKAVGLGLEAGPTVA